MQAIAAAGQRIGALCACLVIALSLALAPAIAAVKHGPGAHAAEADHRAWQAGQGQAHDIAAADHQDSSDHDHFGAALLAAAAGEFHPAPERTLCPLAFVADGTIGDGPRRPPRLIVT